ncbi:MAG TPA: DUF3037 domain-containing protein [Cytophagaceae bacterium]|jgi:hypothetical protein|nr:DUF3037 domain-containing protein [Cytophagaceae bacterium]
MQEPHLFEYAVIRVVPRVEREEFINVGVVLYSKKESFLQTIITVDEAKIKALHGEIDCEELDAHLSAFKSICKGGKEAGPIGLLDTASRFRWLTAQRSTILQTSKVHPGLCEALDAELVKLHRQLVL